MNVVVFGSTGMVGAGVLLECLDDERVTSVLAINRTPLGRTHPKLREIVHEDFFDFDVLGAQFATLDACLFCLGVTSVGLDEATYAHMTYDLTMAAARALVSPRLTFCYVSGSGTDTSEQGSRMWARVKGRTENAILALPFKAAYMFRPGYIQPLRHVRSKTGWYQTVYNVLAPLYPLLHAAFPGFTTSTVDIGRAMVNVAASGYPTRVLESRDIAAAARSVLNGGAHVTEG